MMPRPKNTPAQAEKCQDTPTDPPQSQSQTTGEGGIISKEATALIDALKNPEVIKTFVKILEPSLDKIVTKIISESLGPIMQKIESIESELGNRIEDITTKINCVDIEMTEKIEANQAKITKIQRNQDDIQSKLKTLDRMSKSHNLKIHGIQVKTTDGNSLHDNITSSVMEVVREAGIQNINEEDFDSFIRITPAGQQQFLIAKMKSPKVKTRLYQQRTKLKNCSTRIFINEDLTKEDSVLFKKARGQVKEGILHSCWSMDGVIYGKATIEGKPFQIKDL